MKQKVVGALKNDPKMREQFLNKVAGPIANCSSAAWFPDHCRESICARSACR
jgi:hypothetical protein